MPVVYHVRLACLTGKDDREIDLRSCAPSSSARSANIGVIAANCGRHCIRIGCYDFSMATRLHTTLMEQGRNMFEELDLKIDRSEPPAIPASFPSQYGFPTACRACSQ